MIPLHFFAEVRMAIGRALRTILLLALVAAGWFIYAAGWGKPPINLFFERIFVRRVLESPQMLTTLGLLEPMGINFHNSRLDDVSDALTLRQLARARKDLAILRSYDRSRLTASQKLSVDELDWFIDQEVRGEPFVEHNYLVQNDSGLQSSFPAFMMNIHPLGSGADANRYNKRLRRAPDQFAQILQGLKDREAKGIVPPRFVVERTLEEMREFITPQPKDHPLYTTLRDKLAKLPNLTESKRSAILAETESALGESIYPSYRQLIAFEEGLLPRTTDDVGVWKFPGGDAFYAWKLRDATTTDLSAEEIHQLGLREVARVQAEIDTVLAGMGIRNTTSGEYFKTLGADSTQVFPDSSPESKTEVLADFQKILDEVQPRIRDSFNLQPSTGLEVRAVEPFREKTSSIAFYQAGSLTGSRKGVFFVRTNNLPQDIPRFTMKTTAYHEGIPGHYFQIEVAAGVKDVPTFRRVIPFTAYLEGWALYAERLAYEQGMYENDPMGNLGRLQWELVRAARLVVDTGIHSMRWTREQATQYFEDTTGKAHGTALSEIDRYIVSPGQACSYMIGRLKILELREKAKGALGEKFDLRAFHDVVLENGALPLSLLERVVDDWIAAKR
jgi:uncharacterized protein (DUF885 family)